MKIRKITEKTQGIVLNALANQALKRHKPTESFFEWCAENNEDHTSKRTLRKWAKQHQKTHVVGAVLESQATIELLMSGHTRETMALGLLASARAARHQAMANGDTRGIAAMADLELRLLGMAKETQPPRELRADDATQDPTAMTDADLARALAAPEPDGMVAGGGHDGDSGASDGAYGSAEG